MRKKVIIATLITVAVLIVTIGVYFSFEKYVTKENVGLYFTKTYDLYSGRRNSGSGDVIIIGGDDGSGDVIIIGGDDNENGEAQTGRPGYTLDAGDWYIQIGTPWKLPNINSNVPDNNYVQGKYWIPKYANMKVYCTEPGIVINYWKVEGKQDSAVYKSTGYYDLPVAAAYIVSAENYGTEEEEIWFEKQQALWNLRNNSLGGYPLNKIYADGYHDYALIETDNKSSHDKRKQFI